MMRISIAAIGLLAGTASAQHFPPIAPSSVPPPKPPSRALLSWTPGEVRCAGEAVTGTPLRRPWSALVWSSTVQIKPVHYTFAIDGSGRPISATRVDADFIPYADDIGPALSASRFPAGRPRENCAVTFMPASQPLEAAPVDDLVSYSITPRSGPLPREGWQRIASGSTCGAAPRPQPLVRVSPNFRQLPATPGVKDWTLVGYDLNASGRPDDVRIVSGTGNAALDRAAAKAMRESRFSSGGRSGCVYPFWRTPGTLAPPPLPEEAAFHPSDAACPGPREWRTSPVLRFPEPYRQRRIEGWAVVSYDVAPWGEVGNVQVLASQPSDDFGKQAIQVMRSARAAPSSQGMSGCVDRVRFVMGPEDMPPPEDAPPQPLY